jgi:hypothetical protein
MRRGRHTLSNFIGNRNSSPVYTPDTTSTLMSYIKGLLNLNDGGRRAVEKLDGAVLAAADPLFTITGGPIQARVVGLVTTLIVGASNLRLTHTTLAPAATINLNAGAVAADDDAVGTFYYNVGATSVFTPSTILGGALLDPVTVEQTEFLLAPGTLNCLGSAARAGVIAWYMTYLPLTPNARVVAAA